MRIHSSLRMTPAIQEGITNNILDWKEILKYESN